MKPRWPSASVVVTFRLARCEPRMANRVKAGGLNGKQKSWPQLTLNGHDEPSGCKSLYPVFVTLSVAGIP